MTDLNHLTIAGALDGLAKKEFTSFEITRACLAQMEKHRHLNAFITETQERALAMAMASDVRRASGQPHGAMEGVPLAIKDLF